MKKIVTIFSGIDIFGLAFAQYFEMVLAVEKDKSAVHNLKINRERFHPNLTIWHRDIYDIKDEEIDKWRGVHGLIGGPPCQAFSSARHGFSEDDKRLAGLDEYLRWVEGIQPEFFVFENTFGLDQGKKKKYFKQFKEKAKSLGYKIKDKELNTHDYGSAQKRKRIIVVGVQESANWTFTFPEPVSESKKKFVRDILKDEALGEYKPYSKKQRDIIKHVPEGGHWKHLPTEDLIERALEGNYKKRDGGMTGTYRRLHRDKACPTLMTSPSQRNTMLTHPIWDRPLSIAEYRRAMGIPEEYQLEGKIKEKYTAIGNAVPYEFGLAISKAIVESQKQKVPIVVQATQEEKEWKQPNFPLENDDDFKQLDLFSIESQEEEWGQLKLF
ncbi:DNA cytosine methyltransferase [Priestia aryabhattai]|uniref:DNA (cytosine-5-)-methyltransferase n=1 Tax=Priestia aryabhattai TaxID=412384 RepID=A0AAX6NCV4_PRIAR|nr:DNA cytosine methyltransferase [Priestia aryabhattai]MDU9693324.1 DNA cytosine methyltransferase [Priestia aryabhattai]